jgi:hypothetical protein
MAACDNLYGNTKQWNELHAFLVKTHPEWINLYMRRQPGEDESEIRICYTADIQKWLIENCPFEWVKNQLDENFVIQKFILGKSHHE